MPLALLPSFSVSRAVLSLISLTSLGFSTNLVLNDLIEDIVNATARGVDVRGPEGNEATFLDVVGFTTDFAAATHVVNRLDHNAAALRTFASLRRVMHEKFTRYGYREKIHSEDSNHLRSFERH